MTTELSVTQVKVEFLRRVEGPQASRRIGGGGAICLTVWDSVFFDGGVENVFVPVDGVSIRSCRFVCGRCTIDGAGHEVISSSGRGREVAEVCRSNGRQRHGHERRLINLRPVGDRAGSG